MMKRSVQIAFALALAWASLFAQPQINGDRAMTPGQNVVGNVTSISKDSLVITPLGGGDPVTIKIGPDTRVMKQRQPAKLEDFKVGEVAFARGSLAGNTLEARIVSSVSPEMAQEIARRQKEGGDMRGGAAGSARAINMEDMGKKFIAGNVKAINETRLTIARADGPTQDIEVDENTSFKRGSESITFPEIKVGDFVSGPGEIKNDVFVAKELVVGRRRGLGTMLGGPRPPSDSPDKLQPASPPKN
jgi:hypothetical protein